MVYNAIVLAIVTFLGMALIYYKLPAFVRRIILKGDLITDVGVAGVTYLFLGGTATALIAAGIVGILVSMSLSYSKNMYIANLEKASNINTESGSKKT